VIIRELTSADTLSVYNIWRECFTNESSYINTFIRECFPLCINLGLYKNEKSEALSMLSLLPCYITVNGTHYPGAYMYGVGTLGSHRGKGYSYTLAEEAFRICIAKGYKFIAVRPAEESLYQLYSKQGFESEIRSRTISYNIKDILNRSSLEKTNSSSSLNPEELFEIKFETQKDSHILLSKEITRYAHLEIIQRRGVCEEVPSTKERLFFCAYPDETNRNSIIITDHSIKTPEDIILCTNSIRAKYPGSTSISLELPFNNENIINEIVREMGPVIDYAISKNCMISTLKNNSSLLSHKLETKFLSLAIE
jgi:ribosomal protein S18 acetylase RimI-like enzyme